MAVDPVDTVEAAAAAHEAEARAAEDRAAAARARAAQLRESAAAAGRRRRPAWPAAAVVVVAVVVIAALTGLSAAMFWQRHTADQRQQQAAAYSAAAKQGVITLMSLDFTDAKVGVQRVIDNATGKFKEEFSAQSDLLVKALEQSKVVTEVTVSEVAVESMTDHSAVVLVSAQSQAANVNDGRKQPQRFRIAVALADDAGQLKLSQVDFV